MKQILLIIGLVVFGVCATIMFCTGDIISGSLITATFIFTAFLLYHTVLWSKRYLLLFGVVLFSSCDNKGLSPDDQFNQLKAPIVLIGKSEVHGWYNITVIDANRAVLTISQLSLSNNIGRSHNVGDTIIH